MCFNGSIIAKSRVTTFTFWQVGHGLPSWGRGLMGAPFGNFFDFQGCLVAKWSNNCCINQSFFNLNEVCFGFESQILKKSPKNESNSLNVTWISSVVRASDFGSLIMSITWGVYA